MKIHFVGIGGVGMSALAQLHAMGSDQVTGSDRLISKGYTDMALWTCLKKLNIALYPQDGSGIDGQTDLVVLSSAIEADNPELLKAQALGIKTMHRSELLAKHVAQHRTVAVSGTSGKSTTTAMVYDILAFAGLSPSVITGASILSLQKEQGVFGNVYKGSSDILVIEADESDGSIVKYHPHLGLCLNLQKDHKEINILQGYFKEFISHCKTAIVNAEEENLRTLAPQAKTFGLHTGDLHPENIKADGFGSDFTIHGQPFRLHLPGLHNVANATAAVAAAVHMGVDLDTCAKALNKFSGIARRFASVGSYNKIEVVDDFAHNPHKLAATIEAAHLRGKRVLAFYQPHAFTSIKMLAPEFVESFATHLGPNDHLWLTEVYYPGGTIPQGISCRTVYEGLKARGANVSYDDCRERLLAEMAAAAQPGDILLVLGARDPTLTDFARKLLAALKERKPVPACPACMLGNCCMHYSK
ncbi:MAG: Mur ligase family protein [Elusimicrobia bacterium]|nr:Mur ligase family protein [Elusimicrobiota bacterium]MDD7502693.1 Mur ligase family protein [Elusimicrobiota bacterium]MDY5729742.1 Mur ligase family protein [Elusimicrobiaceae bacterium]